MTTIAIVDYNVGNLPSVQKAFKAVGHEAVITSDRAVIMAADGVVLPGVGAFAEAMKSLIAFGLDGTIKEYAATGRPLLGICVGLQLLFEVGEEFGLTPGLGLLQGRVTKLPSTVKLPQIGWNLVEPILLDHPIFDEIHEPYYAYFVHSFAADGVQSDQIAAETEYGRRFPSVVARKNIIGIQFHPEKSSRTGLQMLANFGRLVCAQTSSNSTPQST